MFRPTSTRSRRSAPSGLADIAATITTAEGARFRRRARRRHLSRTSPRGRRVARRPDRRGSHRPVMSDYLLGSNAKTIVRHALCSVLVVRLSAARRSPLMRQRPHRRSRPSGVSANMRSPNSDGNDPRRLRIAPIGRGVGLIQTLRGQASTARLSQTSPALGVEVLDRSARRNISCGLIAASPTKMTRWSRP